MHVFEENVATCHPRCPTSGENLTNCSSRCLFCWKKTWQNDLQGSFRVEKAWHSSLYGGENTKKCCPTCLKEGWNYIFTLVLPPPHHMQLVPLFIFSGPAPQTAGLTLNLAKINLKCPLRASTKIVNEVGPSTLYRHWTSESFPRFPTASTEWDVFLPFSLTHIISIIQA